MVKTNVTIWFNKICRIKGLKPNYIKLTINGKTQRDKKTITNAVRFRINQEIKFLYYKKQQLNQQLYPSTSGGGQPTLWYVAACTEQVRQTDKWYNGETVPNT